jgi:hypothetical protein
MKRALLLLSIFLSQSPASAQSSLFRGYGYIDWFEVPTIFAYPAQSECEALRNNHIKGGKQVSACTAVEFFEQFVPTGSPVHVFINVSEGQVPDEAKAKTTVIAIVGSAEDCQHAAPSLARTDPGITQTGCQSSWLVWNPPIQTFPLPR